MTEWVLIIYIYAGMMAKGDSVTMVTIPGYTSEQTCKDAGPYAKSLVSGSVKEYRFVCLPRN
jgi:hypothetical protein